MKHLQNIRKSFLIIFALVLAVSIQLYVKANQESKVLISKNTVYYTPGQQRNCKWVFHISQNLIDQVGSASAVQIGIPESQVHGYIEGLLEVSEDKTLILAFNLPGVIDNKAPLLMTSKYNNTAFPLSKIKFRIFNSTAMIMNLHNSLESCIEEVMR